MSDVPGSAARAFADVVSALTYSFIRAHGGPEFSPAHNRVVRFVVAQCARAPDHLRLPLRLATHLFDVLAVVRSGHRFHRLRPERRAPFVEAWKNAPLAACRDLMRFYESLIVFGWVSMRDDPHG